MTPRQWVRIANGEFAPARTSAAKGQVCNIGASDQQNNSDKPEQESEKASIKRRQVEPCLNLGVARLVGRPSRVEPGAALVEQQRRIEAG